MRLGRADTMITAEEWAQLFNDSIRVAVDTIKAKKENWPVTIQLLTPDMYNKIELPWWHNEKNPREMNDWKDGGERYTIATARENMAALGARHRKRIIGLVQGFEKRLSPILLPAVRISTGKKQHTIIADGCHRSIALSMVTYEPRALLAILEAEPAGQWDLTIGS